MIKFKKVYSTSERPCEQLSVGMVEQRDAFKREIERLKAEGCEVVYEDDSSCFAQYRSSGEREIGAAFGRMLLFLLAQPFANWTTFGPGWPGWIGARSVRKPVTYGPLWPGWFGEHRDRLPKFGLPLVPGKQVEIEFQSGPVVAKVEKREPELKSCSLLEPGESGYVDPSFMHADQDGHLFLMRSALVSPIPTGRYRLGVIANEDGRLEVDASKCRDCKWWHFFDGEIEGEPEVARVFW